MKWASKNRTPRGSFHPGRENFCPEAKTDLWLRMILPSDDNSTPRKKPGKRKPEPPASSSGEPVEPNIYEVLNKMHEAMGPLEGFPMQELEPHEWRELLKSELVRAVDDLENFPDPDTEFDPPDPPDLYSFYSELIALREDLSERPPGTATVQLPTSFAVQLGLLAGEMKAAGQERFAQRLLDLLDNFGS